MILLWFEGMIGNGIGFACVYLSVCVCMCVCALNLSFTGQGKVVLMKLFIQVFFGEPVQHEPCSPPPPAKEAPQHKNSLLPINSTLRVLMDPVTYTHSDASTLQLGKRSNFSWSAEILGLELEGVVKQIGF